jgi:8-oxo-dGTP pyrophosphatase MutT (NUDIX family)
MTSREPRRWTVPKGWPHEGRTPHRSAASEAYEEAGVVGRVQRGSAWILCPATSRRGPPPEHSTLSCNIEDVHEDFFALAIDLVEPLRSKEVEALRADGLHERSTAAGQDDHAVIRIGGDRVK